MQVIYKWGSYSCRFLELRESSSFCQSIHPMCCYLMSNQPAHWRNEFSALADLTIYDTCTHWGSWSLYWGIHSKGYLSFYHYHETQSFKSRAENSEFLLSQTAHYYDWLIPYPLPEGLVSEVFWWNKTVYIRNTTAKNTNNNMQDIDNQEMPWRLKSK